MGAAWIQPLRPHVLALSVAVGPGTGGGSWRCRLMKAPLALEKCVSGAGNVLSLGRKLAAEVM